jgi:uncharacterized Zn finger protein (UPF0148 family)
MFFHKGVSGNMNEVIKKMADSLRAGATMLPDNCPACNSPLFRLKDKTYCVKCGWSSAPTSPATSPSAHLEAGSLKVMVPQMSSTILTKLKKLNAEVGEASDLVRLSQLSELILTLLKILEVLERFDKS